jgi:DNA-binding transcriptional regulator YiaG
MELQENQLPTQKSTDIAQARPSEDEIASIIAFRKQLKESQERFWHRLGVPQSSGSRYETRRLKVPEPVLLLLRLRMSGRISNDDLYGAHQPLNQEPIPDESGAVRRLAAPTRRCYFV